MKLTFEVSITVSGHPHPHSIKWSKPENVSFNLLNIFKGLKEIVKSQKLLMLVCVCCVVYKAKRPFILIHVTDKNTLKNAILVTEILTA